MSEHLDLLHPFVAEARWFGGKGRPFAITSVRRPNVIWFGLIVGVMIPTRSSSDMTRFIRSMSGSLIAWDPATSTCSMSR